jgi:hypothetical protein
MTAEQARAVLGNEVADRIETAAAAPLTDEQVSRLVPLLLAADTAPAVDTAA